MNFGSWVAIVTPMHNDGEIDYSAFEGLVRKQLEAGSDGIVVAGTTGEAAGLSAKEYQVLIERTVSISAGQCQVIAGAGHVDTHKAIALAKMAQTSGAEGCLVVAPYYCKPTQMGMKKHFEAIAAAVECPIILYNVPSRTASDLLPETVADLAQQQSIVAIKEASNDLKRVTWLRENCGPQFGLLSGDDASAAQFMTLGGDGVISVTANIVPKQMKALCNAFKAHDFNLANSLDIKLQALHQSLFIEPNPIPVKWALWRLGLISQGIRLPLTPLSPDAQIKLQASLTHLNLV